MEIFRESKGEWKFKSFSKSIDPVYKDALTNYLNAFSHLFEKAKNTCEFEFILTLLRVRGLQDAGWDPFENTQKVFKCMTQLVEKIRDFETNLHLHLWLYGHIIEASEPYEILANLIKICSGKRFCGNNFPDKKRDKYTCPKTAAEKIRELESMASNINMTDCIFPLKDMFDRNLRNAIFHADYSLYGDEVRIMQPIKSYSLEEIKKIIIKGGAYYQAIENNFNYHIRAYDKTMTIPVHKDFGSHPHERAAIIIRKNYGLVGIKDNWTNDELKRGYMPYRLGHFHKYELKLLNKDPFLTILPADKIKKANKFLKLCPKFLRKYVIKELRKKL